MTVRLLLVAIVVAAACGRTRADDRADDIPTLIVADTSFATSGNWTVMGVEVDTSGVVYIADFSRLGVYVRGPRDSVARVFGRAGDGPGEFRYLYRLRRCGSQVVAYDFVHGSLTAVTRDGLGQGEQLPVALRLADFVGCDAEGRRYFTKMPDDAVSPGRQVRPIMLLRQSPPMDVIDTIATFVGTEIFVSNKWHAFREVPFGIQTFVVAGPSGVTYADNSQLRLTSIESTGGRRTLYSEKVGERVVTARDRELYLNERLQLEPDSGGRAKLRKVLAEADWGKQLPQLDRLIAGHDGTIWVRRTPAPDDSAAAWLAVAPNGQYRETLLLPRETRVMSADKNLLALVDELSNGEERVMVVRLARSQ